MHIVELIFKEGLEEYSVTLALDHNVTIESAFIDIKNYVKSPSRCVYLQFKHNQPVTLLHLTNVSPFIFLFFDNDFKYRGASYSIKNEHTKGSYTLQTQYENCLCLNIEHNLKLKNLKALQLNR